MKNGARSSLSSMTKSASTEPPENLAPMSSIRLPGFAAMMEHLDNEVGEILDAVAETGHRRQHVDHVCQ